MKIYNAKIFTMDAENTVIENGWVEILGSKITSVGTGNTTVDENDIDAGGKMLLPGFIDAHTHLGIIGNGLGFESDEIGRAHV